MRGERGESEKLKRRGPVIGSERLQVNVGMLNSNVSVVARPADQSLNSYLRKPDVL